MREPKEVDDQEQQQRLHQKKSIALIASHLIIKQAQVLTNSRSGPKSGLPEPTAAAAPPVGV